MGFWHLYKAYRAYSDLNHIKIIVGSFLVGNRAVKIPDLRVSLIKKTSGGIECKKPVGIYLGRVKVIFGG